MSTKEYQKKWREENKERIKKYSKDWREENADYQKYQKDWREKNADHKKRYAKKYHIERKYNISWEEYQEMLSKTNGVCPLCLNEFILTEGQGCRKNMPVLDHCHKTGVNRGIICQSCNLTIGKVNEDVETLQRMVEYLRK